MNIQIKHISTHQTAKVFAILMALSSFLFMLPFSLISLFLSGSMNVNDQGGGFGSFGLMFLIMPVVQGVLGYLIMRFGFWLYNLLTPRIGGIELAFETIDSQASEHQ